MAGIIVADTLQDGAGNSTAMDNAIYGSAKAWVNFSAAGGTITIRSNYNVSSVTRTATGFYTIVMTNALVDANYVIMGNASENWGTSNIIAPQLNTNSSDTQTAPTNTTFLVKVANTGGTGTDVTYINLAVIR